jgi:hypothetical protein
VPQIRKLSPAEVETLQYKPKGQRKIILEQYDAILSDYAVGEYGEALLEPEEKRLTVRNRLAAAAKRRGLGITFRRTSGELLRFQITAHSNGDSAPVEPPPVVSSEPPAPAKRKGGRPKKTA